MQIETDRHPGARFLLVLASLVICIAGLKAAAPILVPVALAIFIAIVSMPVMFQLRLRRVPAPLAILLTVLTDVLVFGLLILLGVNSLGDLTQRVPVYRAEVRERVDEWALWLAQRGLPEMEYLRQNFFDPGSIFDFVGGTLQWAAETLGLAFIVTIIGVFVLAEATVFPYKFQAIFGQSRTSRTGISKTIQEVQAYLGIKTIMSLITGLLSGIVCWAVGVDFPVLMGLLAFVLNFIPTIGSIIGAIPPMVLAVILYGWPQAITVAAGYLLIHALIGNLLEPHIMGRRMGLSTLIIVMSLLFWGWVWGAVGALLSVPLTMVLKIALENTPDLRWIAVLLDKQPPQARQASNATMEADMLAPELTDGEPFLAKNR
jgi:AI-2 transport protein TqsA